jgi:thioredoxin-dependent peroxiredoxin
VNPQRAASHAGFRQKQHLPFPLLVDKGQKVAELYHANGIIVKRTVYLIGVDGKIRFAKRGMPSPDEVLAALK